MTRRAVGELLAAAQARLAAAGIESPRREARLLLAHAAGLSPGELVTMAPETPVEPGGFEALLARRAAREPMAYLLGRQPFWTLDLAVSRATLIPRADSEALIEGLLAARPDRTAVRRIMDLGTGTGCLLLAALSEYSQAWGLGIDIEPAAGHLAAANARDNGLADRSAFFCGDWADALGPARFDVILSNPPYIPEADIGGLMPEVAHHEPVRALAGGADGLEAYRLLMPLLDRHLAPGGLAVLEVGQGQAADVSHLGAAAGLKPLGVRMDLGGVARAVLLEKQVGIGQLAR